MINLADIIEDVANLAAFCHCRLNRNFVSYKNRPIRLTEEQQMRLTLMLFLISFVIIIIERYQLVMNSCNSNVTLSVIRP